MGDHQKRVRSSHVEKAGIQTDREIVFQGVAQVVFPLLPKEEIEGSRFGSVLRRTDDFSRAMLGELAEAVLKKSIDGKGFAGEART